MYSGGSRRVSKSVSASVELSVRSTRIKNASRVCSSMMFKGRSSDTARRITYATDRTSIASRRSGAPHQQSSPLGPEELQLAEASIRYLTAFLAFQPPLIFKFAGQSIPVGGPLSGGHSFRSSELLCGPISLFIFQRFVRDRRLIRLFGCVREGRPWTEQLYAIRNN